MIDNTTGYIKLNRFSETTYDEFIAALKKLKQSGMKRLVIDLRQNGGGLLNAATDIIDEGTASASEILAGAMQDWDRGVIVGRRSFGKGLVQEQYGLSDGSALRL